MTALVFALQPEQVCLAMDTLVIGAEDRMPMSFQRNFRLVPQTDLVIAGTGRAGFINGWFEHHRSHFLEKSIDELNAEFPRIFSSSVRTERGLGGLTATIYHFGYSALERQYVGYAYRSESGFRSDRLQHALGYKPVVPIAPTDDIRFPDFLIDIVVEQQRHDNLLPLQDRVGIGGEIEFVVMSNREIRIETVHRFPSHEAESTYIAQRAEAEFLAQAERQRQATRARPEVRGTFSQSGPRRARLAQR